jgi:hypothetical protein
MLLRMAAVLAAVAVTVSCASQASGKGLLAPADAAKFTPSSYQPERGYAPQNDGALARQVFRTDTGAPYGAEVRDLLVPPGKSATLAHDGIVLADTREGTGTASVQGQDITLAPGTTFGLSQGQTANVRNGGRTPLLLRVYIVTVR